MSLSKIWPKKQPRIRPDIAAHCSRKVLLTPLEEQHLDALLEWRSQKEARQHQPITALDRTRLEQFIDSRKSHSLEDLADSDFILIITDCETHTTVGWITLEIMSRVHGLARLGYTVDRNHWGAGYATSAVITLADMLFNQTGIERLEADCSIHNPASMRVLEKCGFSHVGIKRAYLVVNGRRLDHHNYELLNVDFYE